MIVNTEEEYQGIQQANEAVGKVLREMKLRARPGMSTLELDQIGFELLKQYGARSAPKKDYDFPGHTCISLNQEACHGIPKADRILKEGDLVNIDVSAERNGFYGDNGSSFILGEDHQNLQSLVDASLDILLLALRKIKPGIKIAAIGGYIEKLAKARKFAVVKNICGHGIGRRLHEEPTEIPCYRDRYNKERFRKNSVIAVETFISTKATFVHQASDGWTLQPQDDSYVAQHEHTVIVRDNGVEILTASNGF
ncbi:MAG TPA: type I methionyl aminopeptidase [Saprospiraceae bacterium]|nr:type I methionyl aminopeptidase [Saprospiraceae bacterium]